jgi:hypoxanthine phosphoribosyltransferase
MAIKYLPLTWENYHIYTQHLAATLLTHDPSINEIVAISRGGLTFGHLLSDLLRIPIWTIAIQSYTDIQTQGEIKINGKLQTSIEEKHILLVDDVSDSGKTLERAVEYLQEGNPKKITTMTMFYKPHSVYRPDYFAKQTTRWILFPYEPTEMILLISKQLIKEKKTKKEIQQFLNSIGYTDTQIAFTRKYHLGREKNK